MTEAVGIYVESLAYNAGAWLLTYAIHSSLLIGGAWILTRGRTWSPVWEAWLWKMALVGGVVTATVRIVPPTVTGAPGFANSVVLTGGAGAAIATAGSIGAIVGIVGLIRSRRRRALLFAELSDRTAAEPALQRTLRQLAKSSGVMDRVYVTRSARTDVPVAIGSSEVCVPSVGFDALDPEQQRSVMAHELGHLARRDDRWLRIYALVRAILFVQPLNAVAGRRIRESAEFLADDFALRQTGSPRPLVEALLLLGGRVTSDVAIASAFTDESLLLRRTKRLLRVGTGYPSPSITTRLLVTTILLLLVALLVPGAAPPCDCQLL